LLCLYFNSTVEYFTPVLEKDFRNTQALTLVIYEAMVEAMSLGFSQWNWGGTWLNQDGVYDFKKRWGTTEYRYFYFTKVYDKTLQKTTKEYLLSEYPGLYLLPFDNLEV
jgi:lipid II:glycine glycyltransferase (peptidoglycan interpeptide bridge formation enzyme)